MLNDKSNVQVKILNGESVLLVATVKPETDTTLLEFRSLSRRLAEACKNMISCNTILSGTENKVEYRIRVLHMLGKPELISLLLSELSQSTLNFEEVIKP